MPIKIKVFWEKEPVFLIFREDLFQAECGAERREF